MSLGYLVCPTIQIQDINGKPIVGAKIYVYDANTSELTNTYKDFEGHLNTNPVLTDDFGNCTIIADDSKVYNIVVNDNNDNLLFSKDNLTCGSSVTYMSVDAGYGITITENDGTYTIAVDTDLIATKDDLATKQDKLYAGDNIEIDDENQINVVNRREFQVQYPLRLDRSNDRLRLYIDNVFEIKDISAGPDIKITESGNTSFIGVDTNGVSNGNYNFVAGYNTSANGNYNFVGGAGNIVDNHDCNTIFGQYATSGDYYFAVGNGTNAANRSNAFEVRKNGDIYYKYDNIMHQLKPDTIDVYNRPIVYSTHSLTSSEISNRRFSETIDMTDFWNWLATGNITSFPIITIQIFALGGLGSSETVTYSMNCTYTGGVTNTPFVITQPFTILGINAQRTWFISKPNDLSRVYLEFLWNGNSFTVGDTIYYAITIQSIKYT